MKEYEFQNGGYDIKINRLDTPYPWVNFLTNTRLSAMISQAGGGYLWYKDPCRFRLTRYRYNTLPTDTPGFYLYIKEKNGRAWCPTFNPMYDRETKRYTVHRSGETVYYAVNGGTEAILSFFIPPNQDTLIWELTLKNTAGEDREYDVFAYAELSQYNWMSEQVFGYYWQHMLSTRFEPEHEFLYYHFNMAGDDHKKATYPLVYFASDRKIKSFSGDRDAFVGDYRSEADPVAIEKGILGGEEINSGNGAAALHVEADCKAGGSTTLHFFLGAEQGALADFSGAMARTAASVKALRNKEYVAQQRRELEESYKKHFSHYICSIPDKTAERQINYWGPLNALQFSLFHQTPQPSAPGIRGIGARDKVQALMPMVFRAPKRVKDSFLFVLSVQYINGAISHNINGIMHEYAKIGAYKTSDIKSDDHLWLPFLAYSVVAENDLSVLDIQVGYRDLDGKPTEYTESVWQHLMRIADFTQSNRGEHGLPLMFDGDWNDIISKFSHKGRGESVFAGEQYVTALRKLIELADAGGKTDDKIILEGYLAEQLENLEKYAYNGKWWYRCFNDEGEPIGAEGDIFGKLWLNPQSWAVISNTGTKEQQASGMRAVENTLDTGYGLTLLYPGFKTYPEVSDPFSPYNPGTGENGAIFCHAHTWAIIAEAKRGNAEKAWKFYCDLLPSNLVDRLGIDTYKSDPFGWVSNIVGPENKKHGWGNVIRHSGTSSWMNIAATQYLLGVRTTVSGLKLDPCVPADWKEFSVVRDYLGCRVNITFKNHDGHTKGIRCAEIDGVRYECNVIPRATFEGKKEVSIIAIM